MMTRHQPCYTLDWLTFSRNIFSFESHMVSVPVTQPCQCSTRTAIDDMYTQDCGCVLMKLDKDRGGPDSAHAVVCPPLI